MLNQAKGTAVDATYGERKPVLLKRKRFR